RDCRYRCFLPDLAGFAASSCVGPSYHSRASDISESIQRRGWDSNPRYLLGTRALQARPFDRSGTSPHYKVSSCEVKRPLRFMGWWSGEGGIRTHGTRWVHTLSRRAPSTARPPLQSQTLLNSYAEFFAPLGSRKISPVSP